MEDMVAKDKSGFQIYIVPSVFRFMFFQTQIDIGEFLRGFRILEIKCHKKVLLRMAEINTGESIKDNMWVCC